MKNVEQDCLSFRAKRRNLIIIPIVLLMTKVCLSQTGGSVGMSYLKIGVDARAAAMGEAYTSLAGDAAATYWNPAGLARATANSVVLMHNSWIQGVMAWMWGALERIFLCLQRWYTAGQSCI